MRFSVIRFRNLGFSVLLLFRTSRLQLREEASLGSDGAIRTCRRLSSIDWITPCETNSWNAQQRSWDVRARATWYYILYYIIDDIVKRETKDYRFISWINWKKILLFIHKIYWWLTGRSTIKSENIVPQKISLKKSSLRKLPQSITIVPLDGCRHAFSISTGSTVIFVPGPALIAASRARHLHRVRGKRNHPWQCSKRKVPFPVLGNALGRHECRRPSSWRGSG